MEKTATLNLGENPAGKGRAEKGLSQLGVPMSKAPLSIHADTMTTEEIQQKLEKGYDDFAAERVQNAADAFVKFREKR